MSWAVLRRRVQAVDYAKYKEFRELLALTPGKRDPRRERLVRLVQRRQKKAIARLIEYCLCLASGEKDR